MTDRLFDTYPTHLAKARLTPGQFAIRVVDMARRAGVDAQVASTELDQAFALLKSKIGRV